MKKLMLDLDKLEIATCEPLADDAVAELRGTVDARALPTDRDRCSAVDACLTRICDTLIC